MFKVGFVKRTSPKKSDVSRDSCVNRSVPKKIMYRAGPLSEPTLKNYSL
jgi:hypothetical protein